MSKEKERGGGGEERKRRKKRERIVKILPLFRLKQDWTSALAIIGSSLYMLGFSTVFFFIII